MKRRQFRKTLAAMALVPSLPIPAPTKVGMFTGFDLAGLEEIPLFKPRYNIAPTQQAPVIANLDDANRLELFPWGLVPWWAKDISIGNRMINARAESLAEKSSFKSLLKTAAVWC